MLKLFKKKRIVRKRTEPISSKHSEGRVKPRVNTVGILIALWAITALSIAIFLLYKAVDSTLAVDPNCSICASTTKFLEKNEVSSTLYVLEGENSRIQSAWIVVENEKSGDTVVLNIPPGVYLDSYSSALGEYVSISDLKYAGNVISQRTDTQYMIEQIQNFVGITFEKYLYFDFDAVNSFSAITDNSADSEMSTYKSMYINSVDEISSQALSINPFFENYSLIDVLFNLNKWKIFAKSLDTNLNGRELIANLNSTKGILESGKVYMLDLTQSWAVIEGSHNGRNVYFPNYLGIDEKLEKYLSILRGRELEKELAKVEVYNGSETAGLAFRYARRIQNNGVRVVRYDNSPEISEKTKIYVSNDEKYSESLLLVRKLISEDAEVVKGRPQFITTGDIIVIIGKDLEKLQRWD